MSIPEDAGMEPMFGKNGEILGYSIVPPDEYVANSQRWIIDNMHPLLGPAKPWMFPEETCFGFHNEHVFEWKVRNKAIRSRDYVMAEIGHYYPRRSDTEDLILGDCKQAAIREVAGLHDAHVAANPTFRIRRELLDMTFYHQIYSVPLLKPRSLP